MQHRINGISLDVIPANSGFDNMCKTAKIIYGGVYGTTKISDYETGGDKRTAVYDGDTAYATAG
jgi:hypothetical protein